MAIKTIEYEIDLAGITPATEQFGGTQGDHRVTKLEFVLSRDLYDDITHAIADKVIYHFDVYDGEGGVWQSEVKELGTEKIGIELEERHTRYGGKVVVYLVITALSADNGTEIELYSFPAVLRLKNRPEGTYSDGENHESVSGLAEIAKANAESAASYSASAQAAEASARQFAAEVEQKLANGEFDGKDGTSVTHSFDGTVLKMTSASGTTEVDLKGDTGPKGEKGDKGDAGQDGKNAVADQYYNPESQNAQSGTAVADAVEVAKSQSIPRPVSQYGAPPPFAITFYDVYQTDENGKAIYLPDEQFGQREIDDGRVWEKGQVNEAKGWLVARDSKGNLWTGTPVDDQDCVPFKTFQNLHSDVSILQSETIKRSGLANGIHENVYADDAYGFQTMIQIEDNSLFESEGKSGIIPRRQFNGNLMTNTPVKDLDCANKAYVDTLIGDIETALDNIIAIQNEFIGGDSI